MAAKPWKVKFLYEGQKPATHAFVDVYQAVKLRTEVCQRGGQAEVWYTLSTGQTVLATDDVIQGVLDSQGHGATVADLVDMYAS